MPRSSLPPIKTPLPPEGGTGKMSRLMAEVRWFLMLAICLGLFAVLITYTKSDPAWSHASFETPQNIGGRIGAWTADIMLYVFGISAFWWVVLFARRVIKGWRELWSVPLPVDPNIKPESVVTRWLGFGLTLICSMGLESIRLHSLQWELPRPPGGILGEVIGDPLQMAFGFTGSTLILLFGLAVGLSLFLHFSWINLSEQVGRHLELSVRRLREKREKQEDLKIGEQAAVEREEHVEEVRIREEVAPKVQIFNQPLKIVKSERVEREKQQPLFVEIPDSELPPLSLLDPVPEAKETISADTLEFTSRLIERKLDDFGVQAKVIAAYPGPVVTRYEIEPATGVKGSQVVNLAKDLARSLSMVSIRVVETIPGKNFMALELPNSKRQTIRLSEILGSSVYNEAKSMLTMGLGKDIGGNPVVADLAKMPHVLVAGTTGSGKSVGINAMILSLLYKAEARDVRMLMIDPKMLEMSVYEGIPHLLAPVVTDMKQAANGLNWCVGEMERRYKLMSKLGVRNLAGYNHKLDEARENGQALTNPFSLTPDEPEPLDRLPHIVVVIDELADLRMVVGKKIEELIARLAQKARAAGIHLILATQRPSVDVITGLIKANIPTRIAFQVSSKIDSRTILDQMGAEALLGMGDMLYLPSGTGFPIRVHGAFVSDEEVHRVVSYLKTQGEPNYIEGVLEGGTVEGGSEGPDLFGDIAGEKDPLYDQAVEVVLKNRKASISLVQRHLKIGYNRAARLVEDMEKAGLVSAMSTNGQREILVPTRAE